MDDRPGRKATREGAPTPGRGGASDAAPLSLIRRLYIAAQRTGCGRRYLASLRAHLRQEAGDPTIVLRQLIDAFGNEPFPFVDVDLDVQPRAQALRRAFGEAPYPYPGVTDEVVEHISPERWMIDVPLLSDAVRRYVLPRVMADLLTVYPGEFRCTDLVVQYLDVEGDRRPEELKEVVPLVEKVVGRGLGMQWVREYNEEADPRREGKLAHFSRFTALQRRAVLSWLLLARAWPECAAIQYNINTAIDHWRRQCESE